MTTATRRTNVFCTPRAVRSGSPSTGIDRHAGWPSLTRGQWFLFRTGTTAASERRAGERVRVSNRAGCGCRGGGDFSGRPTESDDKGDLGQHTAVLQAGGVDRAVRRLLARNRQRASSRRRVAGGGGVDPVPDRSTLTRYGRAVARDHFVGTDQWSMVATHIDEHRFVYE